MIYRVLPTTAFFFFTMLTMASAADVIRHLSIEKAMDSGKVRAALISEVALFFAGESHPAVVQEFGLFKTSKRTNSFMKDKVDSCEWAFASALQKLQQNAINHGGNAVIEITSNVRNRKNPSTIQFDCLVGSMMVNVALQARVVDLEQ